MSKPRRPARSVARSCRTLAPALAAAALLASPILAQQPTESDEPIVYRGRTVADVMSYRGAPWLERDSRESEEDTEALLSKLDLRPGQNVADIGAGSGFYSRRMARLVAPEGSVFAVDVQPEMLRILGELAKRDGVSNIVTVQGRDDNPYLPEGEIDWILLVDVYHELQQPEAMLERMRAALSPNGRVALVEYRLEGESARHIKLDHRMSPAQVRREWEPAGFELVELWEELPTQHLFIFRATD
jgi:precorrin-6B methylase 2